MAYTSHSSKPSPLNFECIVTNVCICIVLYVAKEPTTSVTSATWIIHLDIVSDAMSLTRAAMG